MTPLKSKILLILLTDKPETRQIL